MLAGIFGAKAQWCIVGDFSSWTSLEMTEQTDGSWIITLDELEGAFKFNKDYIWDVSFGVDYQGIVYGNGTIPLRENSPWNLEASPAMKNVTITLNPEAKSATFTGLPSDMDEVDASKPYVMNKGCFLVYSSPDYGTAMTLGNDGCYSITNSMKAGARFRISSALINVPEEEGMEEEAWNVFHQYEYAPANVTDEMAAAGVAEVQLNQPVNLQTPTPYNIDWQVTESGVYTIKVDPNAMTMVVEREEPKLYICGNVKNPETGMINDFLSPSSANRDLYDSNFAFTKIADGVFYGEFIISYAGVDVPQFRFFSDLLGWIPDASLGSAYEDFYALPVNITPVTLPIFEGGLGNWGWDFPYYEGYNPTVEITVDLNKMEVTLAHKRDIDTAVDEISASEEDATWYDLQGHRISAPSKGIYIRVTPTGTKKVQL